MCETASGCVKDEIGKICSQTSRSAVALQSRPVKEPVSAFSHNQDPKLKLRLVTFTAISRFTDDLACLVSCMSLANVVINDAHAGLADVEAHQVGPNQQRSAISLAGLLDDVVNGGLGIVLIA